MQRQPGVWDGRVPEYNILNWMKNGGHVTIYLNRIPFALLHDGQLYISTFIAVLVGISRIASNGRTAEAEEEITELGEKIARLELER